MTKVEEIYRLVGMRIRAAREERGLNQAALAAQTSLSRVSITNIEQGKQRLLLHDLCDIAAALGKDPRDLLPDSTDVPQTSELDKALPDHLSSVEKLWIRSMVESQKGGNRGRP